MVVKKKNSEKENWEVKETYLPEIQNSGLEKNYAWYLQGNEYEMKILMEK